MALTGCSNLVAYNSPTFFFARRPIADIDCDIILKGLALVSSHCKSDVFIVVFPLSSIKVARLETWHHGIK